MVKISPFQRTETYEVYVCRPVERPVEFFCYFPIKITPVHPGGVFDDVVWIVSVGGTCPGAEHQLCLSAGVSDGYGDHDAESDKYGRGGAGVDVSQCDHLGELWHQWSELDHNGCLRECRHRGHR